MISKMGGRLIHYYADDLTDLLLEDVLMDTVMELQVIEQKERESNTIHESKQLAENLLKHVIDFQSEEHLVQQRWVKEKANAKKTGNKIDIAGENYYEIEDVLNQRNPKSLHFKDDEFGEGSQSFGKGSKYVNPFET